MVDKVNSPLEVIPVMDWVGIQYKKYKGVLVFAKQQGLDGQVDGEGAAFVSFAGYFDLAAMGFDKGFNDE